MKRAFLGMIILAGFFIASKSSARTMVEVDRWAHFIGNFCVLHYPEPEAGTFICDGMSLCTEHMLTVCREKIERLKKK